MKLDTPIKLLTVTPSEELLNFDFNSIPWDTYSQKMYSVLHSSSYNFTLARTPFDKPSQDRKLLNTDSPIFSITMNEVQKLEQLYDATAKIVVFLKMKANSSNPVHSDVSNLFQISHRCYLPLKTNNQSYIEIENNNYQTPVGKWVEIDNLRPYRSINNSDTEERIHLMVDLVPNVLPAV